MNCNEVLEQLADFLDEDARRELCEAIGAHLQQCHDCQVYVDTVKKTIVLYQSDHAVSAPLQVTRQLQAALAKEYSFSGPTDRPSD